jgi:hypothetical protein
MFVLSKIHSGHRGKGGALSQNRIWLRILVLASLGSMIFTMLCVIPGCGSNSISEKSGKGKNARAVTSPKPKTMQESISLLAFKGETDREKMTKIQKQPEPNFAGPIPSVTQQEFEASLAADREIIESADTEIFPGMTQAQLDAQNANQGVPNDWELFPPPMEK